MKKTIALILAVLMLVAVFAGCAAKTDDTAKESASETKTEEKEEKKEETKEEETKEETKDLKDMHFAYISSSTNDYWTQLQNGVQDAAEAAGIDLTYTIGAQGDVAAAVANIDAAIGAGVDGIICTCVDPAACIDVVNKAVAQGIMVVFVDQDSPDSDRQYYVGTSNYESGVMMGEYFLDRVGDKEMKVAIYAGDISANNAVERIQGFKDTVKDHDNIEIVTYEQVNNDVQITMDKTYALFNGYPDVNAIYGVLAYDPLGAAKACKELGKDDVFVFGFDDFPDSIELMKEGWIQGLAVQQPYEIGRIAVETVIAAAQGNGPEFGSINTSIDIVTPENVNDNY